MPAFNPRHSAQKLHATERCGPRSTTPWDIQGGKAVIDGPQKLFSAIAPAALPVGINVEGANI